MRAGTGSGIIVALVMAWCTSSVAQASEEKPTPTASEPRTARETVRAEPSWGARRLWLDTRYLFTRPVHLDRKGWSKVAWTGGAVVALYAMREPIRDFAVDHPRGDHSRLLDGARTMGKGAFAPSIALALLLGSFATGNVREKESAQLLVESVAYSALVATAGQFVLATDRPRDGNDIQFFRSGGHGISGDAAIAASAVAPLRRQYLLVRPEDGTWTRVWKRSATVLLYAGAGLTAYQRLNTNAHWAPDAFLGTMTGLTVGEILCDAHHGRTSDRAAPTVGVMAGRNGFGIWYSP